MPRLFKFIYNIHNSKDDNLLLKQLMNIGNLMLLLKPILQNSS